MEQKKRLIDANKLWVALDEAGLFDDGNPRHIAQQTVEEQPTVDAVEVVRCKDCKHYMEHPASKRMCCYVHLLTPHHMQPEHFCSYGERKDNGTEKE